MREESLPVPQPAPQPGLARSRLRHATAPDHAAVDAVYSRFDLTDPEGYRAFLLAQHACLGAVEDAVTAAGVVGLLPDWPARRRAPLLRADLDALGAAPRGHCGFGFTLKGPAAVLGAVYVLEGSRFGGAMLARSLPPGAPARFLGAAAQPQAWRALLALLDQHLAAEAEMESAALAARAVFAAFAAAGRLASETADG